MRSVGCFLFSLLSMQPSRWISISKYSRILVKTWIKKQKFLYFLILANFSLSSFWFSSLVCLSVRCHAASGERTSVLCIQSSYAVRWHITVWKFPSSVPRSSQKNSFFVRRPGWIFLRTTAATVSTLQVCLNCISRCNAGIMASHCPFASFLSSFFCFLVSLLISELVLSVLPDSPKYIV